MRHFEQQEIIVDKVKFPWIKQNPERSFIFQQDDDPSCIVSEWFNRKRVTNMDWHNLNLIDLLLGDPWEALQAKTAENSGQKFAKLKQI